MGSKDNGKIWSSTRTPDGRLIRRRKSRAKFADDPSEPERCHAEARPGSGTRCKRKIEPGYMVCRKHGGRTPRGADSWIFALGDAYGGKAERALRDPRLMDLRRPLSLLHMHVERASERLKERDTPEFRERAVTLYRQVISLMNAGDAEASGAAMRELGNLLEAGSNEDAALNELTKVVEKFSRRAEEAWKIHLSRMNVQNSADIVRIYQGILETIRAVADEEVAREIIERLGSVAMRGIPA